MSYHGETARVYTPLPPGDCSIETEYSVEVSQPLAGSNSPSFKSSSKHYETVSHVGEERKSTSVGFKTPFYILICLLAGICSAVGNFSFFLYLHHQQPSSTVPQSWVQTIAVIFANLVRSFLGAALGIAYSQRVWNKLRQVWIKAKYVDQLLTLPWNPLDLIDLKIFWLAKFEWAFALFCVLLPIVTAFPPGSLKVVVREVAQSHPDSFNAPWMNLTFRQDDSYGATTVGALFRMDGHVAISSPKAHIQEAVTNIVRNGEATTWANPRLGHNISYQVTFRGPAIKCFEIAPNVNYTARKFSIVDSLNWTSQHVNTFPGPANKTKDKYQYAFSTAYRYEDHELSGSPAFTLWYRHKTHTVTKPNWHDFETTQSELLRTRCLGGAATYYVNVTHSVGQEGSRVAYHTEENSFKPITNTSFNFHGGVDTMYYYIYGDGSWESRDPTLNSTTNELILPPTAYDSRIWNDRYATPFHVKFFESQCLAIILAFMNSLAGEVYDFGTNTPGYKSNILATRLAKLESKSEGDTLTLNVTPSLLEEAFRNVTVSLPMLNIDGWETEVPIIIKEWTNVYEFEPLRLLVPYALAIPLTLAFTIVRLIALYSNGVPAKGNSFLQIVTTTSAAESSVLREKAALCFEGGEQNFSEELLGLKLKYGELVQIPTRVHASKADSQGSLDSTGHSRATGVYNESEVHSTGILGFGTMGEVIPIRRR
ncbi:hypothetical protein BJ508DRAFT_366868 [Ascobolus immersus RN42]|uniref:Uncharacterized protein n=1 Tax=Ascobolus immersus RN42 TaxID=1160509 RepID=A0A3N4HM51_ASCIM|nr:hypothetical protein BJ508DRAFT_366868 [Ascobolus immersus RN42]